MEVGNDLLGKVPKENTKRLERMQEALMTQAWGRLSFSKGPGCRGGKNTINAAMGG
jgi:hypothetical protein